MKRTCSITQLYLGLAVIFTVGVFCDLLYAPSISDHYFFLNYSLQRFTLIAIAGLFLLLFSLGIFFSKIRFVELIFNGLMGSKFVYALTPMINLSMFLFLWGRIFSVFGERTLFFERVLPVYILILLLGSETFFFQRYKVNNIINQPDQISQQSVSYEQYRLIDRRIWQGMIVFFLIIIFGILLRHAIKLATSSSADPWLIGDWLINYHGGIIRRGLLGELFLHLPQILNAKVVVLIVITQMILYSTFIVNTLRLSINSSFSLRNAVLIFSPAFMLFPILDQQGAFRKEILLFALFSIICIYLASPKNRISKWLFIFIGFASVIIALSHEMLVVYLPYIICTVLIHEKEFNKNFWKVILSLVPAAVVTILIVLLGFGNKQTIIDICNSLKTIAPTNCTTDGAIPFIGQDLKSAHDFVLQNINNSSQLMYALTGFLSFLPILLAVSSKQITRFLKTSKVTVWLALFISAAIVCSLPLFWVAADYGRLIYIHVVCLTLLILMINYESNEVSQDLMPAQIIPMGVSVLFIFGWRLIHYKAFFSSAFPLLVLIKHFF